MIPRRFSLWQKALALAPVLLLLVYLPGQAMLRCRLDGLLRAQCCCAHDGDEEPSPGPVVNAPGCCDREAAPAQRPEAEASAPARDIAPAPTALLASVASVAAPAFDRLDRAAAQRHGPVDEGPPIVLVKQSFLI